MQSTRTSRLGVLCTLAILVLLAASRGVPAGNASPNDSTAVALTPGVAVAPPNSAPIPPVPETGAGCHTYLVNESSSGWQSVPCVQGPVHGPYQIIGGSNNVEAIYGSSPSTTNDGQATIDFSTFSGESDNTYGSNDWSIQVNTNTFTGSNSHTDWVQFVEVNYPTYLTFFGYANVCVEQWDITSGETTPTGDNCASISIQHLSSSFDNYVAGYLYSSGGTNYLEAEYCQVNVQCWSVSTSDLFGLTGDWSDVSGTILGLGAGSTAHFTSPTSLTTYLYLQASSTLTATFGTQYSGAEMNNLTPGTPSHGCSGDVCQVDTPATD
jgi:hypothetical protein